MSTQHGRKCGHDFPCASLDEALPHLSRPPAPETARDSLRVAELHKEFPALLFEALDLVRGEACQAEVENGFCLLARHAGEALKRLPRDLTISRLADRPHRLLPLTQGSDESIDDGQAPAVVVLEIPTARRRNTSTSRRTRSGSRPASSNTREATSSGTRSSPRRMCSVPM